MQMLLPSAQYTLLTLGTYYRASPNWVIRMAGSYNQRQIILITSSGDSTFWYVHRIYDYKYLVIDGSYAHAFMQDKNIHTTIEDSMLNGVNKEPANIFIEADLNV